MCSPVHCSWVNVTPPSPEALRAVLQETQTLFPIMPDFSLFPAMPTCLKAAGDC
ncbi:unnamed protein product, partial [Gulo gulo]